MEKVNSYNIITTNDDKHFVGRDRNEALYNLLNGRGLAVQTPIKATPIKAYQMREMTAIHPIAKRIVPSSVKLGKIAGIPKPIINSPPLVSGTIQRAISNDNHINHRYTAVGYIGNYYKAIKSTDVNPKFGLNPYNSVIITDPEYGYLILAYTGCHRANLLDIRNHYEFHDIQIESTDDQKRFAILLEDDRFAGLKNCVAFDEAILSLSVEGFEKLDESGKREVFNNAKKITDMRFLKETRENHSGIRGYKSEIAKLFGSERMLTEIISSNHRPEHRYRSLSPLNDFKDKCLSEAIATIDSPSSGIISLVLQAYCSDY